jgi:hypothetical protein
MLFKDTKVNAFLITITQNNFVKMPTFLTQFVFKALNNEKSI